MKFTSVILIGKTFSSATFGDCVTTRGHERVRMIHSSKRGKQTPKIITNGAKFSLRMSTFMCTRKSMGALDLLP